MVWGAGFSSFQTDKRYARHLLRCSRQQMHLGNGNGNGIGTLIFRVRGKSFSHVSLTYARHVCRRRTDTDTEKWQFAGAEKERWWNPKSNRRWTCRRSKFLGRETGTYTNAWIWSTSLIMPLGLCLPLSRFIWHFLVLKSSSFLGRSSCGFLPNKNKRISPAWVPLASRDHLFPWRHMPGPLDKHLQKLLLPRWEIQSAFGRGRSIGFGARTLLRNCRAFSVNWAVFNGISWSHYRESTNWYYHCPHVKLEVGFKLYTPTRLLKSWNHFKYKKLQKNV